MEPVPDRRALDVMSGLGMNKAQDFLSISGILLISMKQ